MSEIAVHSARQIIFGSGVRAQLGRHAALLGSRALIACGRNALQASGALDELAASLSGAGVEVSVFARVKAEPSLDTVEAGRAAFRDADCDVVVAAGGGSALDVGKAIAALAPHPEPVAHFFAGAEITGRGAPCIALPTTSGTGAEVTRNAVLLVREHRVKVSMRSPFLLPEVALVDPLRTHSMAPDVTAATGLDALTQLIEAFVTKKANPLTDGICREGLRCAARSLRRAFEDGDDATARQDMALAALFSGLALANAGLGAVHGFAGPLGGMIGTPHGVVCGKLLPHVMATNVKALQDRAPGSPVLARFDEIARIATGNRSARASDGVAWVKDLCGALALPGPVSYTHLTLPTKRIV